MYEKIFGRFYFKRTSNGNLIGEFSNRQSDKIFTESSDLIGNFDGYIGKYQSTWQENGKPGCFANLEILPKNGSNKIFLLIWSDGNGKNIFNGEGMLCDDILIGDYQSTDKQ